MARRRTDDEGPPLSNERIAALFAAGALSAWFHTYHPPLRRDAARHFWDGYTLARQGFIRVTDRAEAEQLVKSMMEGTS